MAFRCFAFIFNQFQSFKYYRHCRVAFITRTSKMLIIIIKDNIGIGIIIIIKLIGIIMVRGDIVWLLLMISVCSACPGKSPNGTLCPNFCRVCTNTLTCTTCCNRYFLNTTSQQCQRCTDLNCQICVQNVTYGTSCTRCLHPYGLSNGPPNSCLLGCSNTTAQQCSAVNNCGSSCISCFSMFVIIDGRCRECTTLWQDCARCNSTHCLGCTNGKVMNKTTYRQCVSCSSIPHCNSCSSGPTCTSCDHGYYPNGSSCQPCRYPCIACTSLTQCTTCNTTDRLYIFYNNSCVKCTDHPNTNNCTQCISSGATFNCFACIDGFYRSGSSCTICISPCLTCTSILTCTSCISSQYVFTGGACNLCNSTLTNCIRCQDQNVCIECQPQYAINVTSPTSVICVICQLFYPHCQTCSNTNCLTCLEGYIINSATSQCIELPCDSPCLACRTSQPSSCLTCIQGYFYNTSATYTCSPCLVGCQSCENQTYCINCILPYENNNGICQLCPVGFFYSTMGRICSPCPSHCLSCDISNCYTCQQFFSLDYISQKYRCLDTCGDGIIIQNQCDLKPNVLVDGCSDTCTIQNGFICSYANNPYNATNGTVMVNTSTCSYTGTVAISVSEAKQSIVSNSIQLTFKVQPYLFGMPTASDTQNYLKSIFILNSTHSLAQFTLSVDQSQGTVTFTIDYLEDLSLANISLAINFDTLSSTNPTLQYLTNTSETFSVSSLQRNGCFGKYSESQNLSFSKLVYNCTLGLSFIGLGLFFIGIFTKQLAGFEQMVLFQTIFSVLVFREGEITQPMLALQGFKYSLALGLPDGSVMVSSSGYLLEITNTNLSGYYLINFLLYLLPLLGFICLLYKLKHKSFAYKAELGRHATDFFKGQLLLYLSLFNIYPLVVYSKLFLGFRDDFFFWDLFLVLVSVLITAYALYNFIFRPQIVGIFRSAFRTFSGSRLQQKNNCIVRFVEYRICSERLGECYQSYAANHYYLFICYQLTSVLLIVCQVPQSSIILICLQALVLIVLIAAKPYFNSLEKIRSILMFFILILANIIQISQINDFTLILSLIVLCFIHVLFSTIALIRSFIVQIKRKCNDRNEVVKKMFKVPEQMKATTNQEKQEIEKSALIQLINRFNESHSINPIHNAINYTSKKKMNSIEQSNLDGDNIGLKIVNEQNECNQEVILEEENEHLRYQRGLAFFDKYGKQIEEDLVKKCYDQI